MMSDEKTIENAIKNAAASVEMEGYHIDEQSKEWCRRLLRKEITMDDYIALVMNKVGISTCRKIQMDGDNSDQRINPKSSSSSSSSSSTGV